MKELFPEGLAEQKWLIRCAKGRLRINKKPIALWRWLKARKRTTNAVKLNILLQKVPELRKCIIPIHGVYKDYGTIYTLSDMKYGTSLDKLTDATVAQIVAATIKIAQMTEVIHQTGWLMVDIKASNYIVIQSSCAKTAEIRMTDFDSAVSLKELHRHIHFMCSSETAPPELLKDEGYNAGPQSDVYSIAAMLLILVTRHPLIKDVKYCFRELVRPRLADWSASGVQDLEDLMIHALAQNPKCRLFSCQKFADILSNICLREGIDYANIYT
jgi:serine/threonine protein kinase